MGLFVFIYMAHRQYDWTFQKTGRQHISSINLEYQFQCGVILFERFVFDPLIYKQTAIQKIHLLGNPFICHHCPSKLSF